ncbi:uncharacterized protein PV09_05009 [Verruconis gallopava]|uniref:Uncharacterized protein n=1 Tax=Verruconis gallopava TaxID=253628 RepID=A0A0D2AWZ1_9PEZI|nr:uncharacterized protein PV09_05009 [Verruconis gallopava]KIW03694.1 hypothetical protein PV09_05009 [Verruconis gallopava]
MGPAKTASRMPSKQLATADDHELPDETDGGDAGGPSLPAEDKAQAKNAFAELMRPKSKPARDDRDAKRPKTTVSATGRAYLGRDGLLAYIAEPEAFGDGRVVYHSAEWVLIRDLYPKASVHLLLLPRDPSVYGLNPLEAFARSPAFLASARAEVARAAAIAAEELRRLHGAHSAQERPRRAALTAAAAAETAELPPGRAWLDEVRAGVHANPSMNHLHIHVISRDMHSPCLRHRTHYQSFTTEFFARIEEMPLSAAEILTRRRGAHEALKERGSVCWRCGAQFGSSWKKLKEHLEVEFETWRRE